VRLASEEEYEVRGATDWWVWTGYLRLSCCSLVAAILSPQPKAPIQHQINIQHADFHDHLAPPHPHPHPRRPGLHHPADRVHQPGQLHHAGQSPPLPFFPSTDPARSKLPKPPITMPPSSSPPSAPPATTAPGSRPLAPQKGSP